MNAHISNGIAHLQLGNENVDAPFNVIPNPAIRTFIYNCFVASGIYPIDSAKHRHYASPGFNRFSGLRYYKDKNYLSSIYHGIYGNDTDFSPYLYPTYANTSNYQCMTVADSAAESLLLTTPSMTIGSLGVYYTCGLGVGTIPAGEYPTGQTGFPLITSVDIPGTTVGNLFKHPVGRASYFNEVGQISLSQGAIAITGVFNPPENLMYSTAYQIYYTKSGGTGTVVGAVKTTGETFPGGTNNYTFKDTTFAGFSAGDADGNHYIAIRSGNNIGTFKITAYIDANTVETDAATINQAFTNESGLTWTMRTGPVGEYFFRRRRYACGSTWVYYPYYAPSYGNVILSDQYTRACGKIQNALNKRPNIVSIHDRGVCRWALADHGAEGATYAPYGLARWVEMSNHTIDYPYLDGDITNMPTGIRYWRDMDIDNTSRNKLWIATDDYTGGATGYSVFKIDPYPSGNGRYPDCVAKYSKQTSATDAGGLPSSNARGICCDTINDRTWVLFGADGTSSGGLAYTEDGGTTWSRMHKLSAVTGTLAVKATGTITTIPDTPAIGQISLSGLPSDGDYVIISDGYSQPFTFEFESGGGVGLGNIPVTIGVDVATTIANLTTAINNTIILITASSSSPNCDLAHDLGGTRGNVAITKSGANITVTGMSGGLLNILAGEKVRLNDGYTPSGLGNVDFWFAREDCTWATGFIYLISQPADGATFTIDDSIAPITFEYDSGGGVTPGNVAITIGGTLAVTAANTSTAINGTISMVRALSVTGAGPYTVNLRQKIVGTTGNLAITKVGSTAYFVGGMARGSFGDFAPSSGNTGTTSTTFATPDGSGNQVVSGMTGGSFSSDSVGHFLDISGSTANDGTWLIVAYISATSVQVYNPYGASETISCTWDQLGNKNNVRAFLPHAALASTIAQALRDAINSTASQIGITAGSVGAGTTLTNDYYGDQGNIAITETVTDPGFTVSGMSGGTAWEVAGDGVTLTNPAGDSAFLTEFAAGDWMTMTGIGTGLKKRKIASITDNNTIVLATSTTFGAAANGWDGLPGIPGSSVKGVLTDAQCRLYFSSTVGEGSTDGYVHPPCDYDTDGRLYWIPDSVGTGGTTAAICRVDVGTTVPETRTNGQLSGANTFENPRTVTVTRFSDVAGSGVTTFQNNVWVGSFATDLTRIYNWATPSITRYYRSVTNAFPTSVALGTAINHRPRVIQEPKSGNIGIAVSAFNNGNPDYYHVTTQVKAANANFGLTTRFGSQFYNLFSMEIGQTGYEWTALTTWNYDDIGLGSFMAFHLPLVENAAVFARTGTLNTPAWGSFRWNGSAWVQGVVNTANADIDFRIAAGGPHTEGSFVCGAGSKRAMEIATPLDNGLYIQFNQAGGGTLQQNEFIIDENTTFTCSVGRVKDNTMTGSYSVDVAALPTIARIDEPVVTAESFWTSDDGFDGGYVNNATDSTNPVYMRGVAEYCGYYANAQTNYPSMAHQWSNPNDPHYLIARRIHETFYDVGDLDIWNDTGVGKAQCPTGTYTFSNADINKTVRVHGAVTGGNNTSKLITAVDTGTNTITLSSAWAADENDRKWTLRLIPAVGYVALVYAACNGGNYEYFLRKGYKLFSSKDAGVTWDAVKSNKYFSGVAANDPITKVGAVGYIDAGMFFDAYSLNCGYAYSSPTWGTQARAMVVDIRELSQEARRRTHWKIHRENSAGDTTDAAYPATMLLLDENYVPMGTASLFVSDRDDARFLTMKPSVNPKAIMYDSTNAATGVDMGYGYSFTDVIQVGGGESFWEQNNTDLVAWANTTKVKSTAATFSVSSVGKKLRVPLMSVTGGTYDGFVTIDTFVDANTVLVSRTIASQATGSISGVTNNAGQAVFASAGHTLSNGDAVTITGTTSYNGQWIVANVVAGVSFEAGVAYVASETGTWNKGQTGLTWALTNFGPTDSVRFDDSTTFFRHVGRPLATLTYEVLDIPASNRIQTKYKDMPLSVSSTLTVERSFTNSTMSWQQTASWDTTFSVGWNARLGCFQVSDSAQFNLIQEDSATETATSSADDDGDGWTNEITLTGITLSAQAAANDWILLYKTTGTMYRRWYKIKSITSYGPGAVIKTYEDELVPSTTFKWKVCRKRGLKMRIPAVNIVGFSQI